MAALLIVRGAVEVAALWKGLGRSRVARRRAQSIGIGFRVSLLILYVEFLVSPFVSEC